MEQALFSTVSLDQRDLLFRSPSQSQIIQRLLIYRENAAGGAVLGRHVADGGAVCQRQFLKSGAEKFHELAHHAMPAQHFGDCKH